MTNDNFEILALNGLTGECLTTDNLPEIPDLDATDATVANLDAIRQEHEPFLTKLEALAVEAIAKGYWDEVYDYINFHAPSTEDS
jgi:hypothetical protein